ncbi:hypothetical protein [Weissella confusa]|uniref:hypothetical protein n=1 Tax=Weissella confusa TaxID=1583 RepID=UPI00107F5576|nr:hypothetical protein [Weissella confusa]TGE66421.1 hypothetical protein C6P17_03410 [Weissella confusa]
MFGFKRRRQDENLSDEDYSFAGEFEKPENTQERLSRLRGESEPTNTPLTREEHRLSGKGRYELDPVTRRLTEVGKTARLKRRLNITIIVLIILIVVTYLVLFLL